MEYQAKIIVDGKRVVIKFDEINVFDCSGINVFDKLMREIIASVEKSWMNLQKG